MIDINLLPEELKKRGARTAPKMDIAHTDLGKLPVVNIGVAAVAVVISAQIAVFVVGILGSTVLNSLESSCNKILPKKRETELLRAEVASMSRKVSAIDELMVKRFSWTRKLNDLSDSVTPGIWLTQLKYEERLIERQRVSPEPALKGRSLPEGGISTEKAFERYFIISGAASSMGEEGTALIGRFIKSLKENPSFYSDFSDIELGSIKREQVKDQSATQEIMTFKITCLFKAR